MNTQKTDLLKIKLKDFQPEFTDINGTPGIYINKDYILEACEILKNDPELLFDSLVDAVSVDNYKKKDRFEMIYNIVSISRNERIFLKIRLDSKNPQMKSLSPVWESANWYEREAYDMMGIVFLDHPDLRRMYMPENFEYFPLRKDFPLMGIPDSLPLPK